MTVEDLIVFSKGKVHSDLAKMLLADLLSVNSLELLLILDKIVSDEIVDKFKKLINELVDGKPIQYVMGHVNFYGNEFIVNNNVLIPRFETEQLVENTINLIKEIWHNNSISLIDLGCGSGVIGLTIKQKLPMVSVTLLDISNKALEVAKTNARNISLDVNFIENDMLNNIEDKYDVIVSNPPYIRENEKIEDVVKNNEPQMALYGGIDGLKYYRQILENVSNNIKDKYLIAFEIGALQKEEIISLIKEYLPENNIITKKDYSNFDRMIFIYKK